MLQLSHVKKSYNRKNEVLSDIDYIFNSGSIYTILGRNGSGRTTLFECISEDITVDSGTIQVSNVRDDVFLASKQSILPMYVTAYEYINFLKEIKGSAVLADEFLEKAGMEEAARDKLIADLSFEDKKRLQLAAFLLQRPSVMMFDEPFDYCSESYVEDFIKVLQEEKQDSVILISTGLLSVAENIPGELLLLNEGKFDVVPKDTLQVAEVRQAVLAIAGEA
jgi:ABC-2 type transport system ATP-binding protein